MQTLQKLCYVDDSSDEHFLAGIFLKRERVKMELKSFADFEEFYEAVSTNKCNCPALVLIDLNLPRTSGIEGLRRLREERLLNQAIIGIFTGSEDPADRASALEAGADFFINKPLNKAALQKVCEQLEGVKCEVSTDGCLVLNRIN